MRNTKGFTLVELMIVMVIIGILLSLLLPGLFSAREEALKTETASNLRQVGIALYAHAKNNNGTLPATLNELNTEGYIDDTSVLSSADGTPFTYSQASQDLYSLTSDAVLAYDDPDNIYLYADGHVAVSN